jgi:hypothetical protein
MARYGPTDAYGQGIPSAAASVEERNSMTIRRLVALTGLVCALLLTAVVPPAAAAMSSTVASPTATRVAVAVAAASDADYCGGTGASAIVPDHWYRANWTSSCNTHDKCYSRTSTTSRLTCDKGLHIDMNAECHSTYVALWPDSKMYSKCLGVANEYYIGVRWGAKGHYHGKGNPA